MLPARIQDRQEALPLINEKVLRGISNLPVIPTVWQKLLTCLEDPWSSLGDLEALIRQEQGLSARVLARANSPFYGLAGQVTSVRMALQVLGLQEVRKLCLGSGLDQVLRASKLYKQAEGQILWQHGLQTAEAASLLAQQLARSDSETAFACGLLHDLGKVLLAACFPLVYQSVRQLQQRQGLAWLLAEQAQDLDHQYLGRFLAQRWGLPTLLVEVIGRHHLPAPGQEHGEMTAIVHLADILAQDPQEPDIVPDDDKARTHWVYSLDCLGLDTQALEACRQKLCQRLEGLGQD